MSAKQRARARGYGLQGLIDKLTDLWSQHGGTVEPAAGQDDGLRLDAEVQPGWTLRRLLEADFMELLKSQGLLPAGSSERVIASAKTMGAKFAGEVTQIQVNAMVVAHPGASPQTISRLLAQEFGHPQVVQLKQNKKAEPEPAPAPGDRAAFMAKFRKAAT